MTDPYELTDEDRAAIEAFERGDTATLIYPDVVRRALRERSAEIERLKEAQEHVDGMTVCFEVMRTQRDEAVKLLQECVDFERLSVDDFEAKYGSLGIEIRNIDGSIETQTIDRAIAFLAQVDGTIR